jgi:hypothetical protein
LRIHRGDGVDPEVPVGVACCTPRAASKGLVSVPRQVRV